MFARGWIIRVDGGRREDPLLANQLLFAFLQAVWILDIEYPGLQVFPVHFSEAAFWRNIVIVCLAERRDNKTLV